MTTSHLDPAGDASSNGLLLPVFVGAFLIAMIPIVAVVASPSVLTLVIAVATIIAFTGGLLMFLGHLIAPEEH